MDLNLRKEEHFQRVKSFYNRDASEYIDVRYGSGTILQLGYIIRRKLAVEMLTNVEGRILDIGCGPGTFLKALRNDKRELYATDLSINMLKEARNDYHNNEECQYFVSNLSSLGINSNSFNGVICIGVLGYIPSLKDALSELYRVMKKGGVAVIQTSNCSAIKEKLYERIVPFIKKKIGIKKIHGFGFDFPLYSYSKKQFDDIIEENGFQLLDWRYYDFHFPFLERFNMCKTIQLALLLQQFEKNKFIGSLFGSGYLINIKKV